MSMSCESVSQFVGNLDDGSIRSTTRQRGTKGEEDILWTDQ